MSTVGTSGDRDDLMLDDDIQILPKRGANRKWYCEVKLEMNGEMHWIDGPEHAGNHNCGFCARHSAI